MTITIRPAPSFDSYRAPRRTFDEPDLLPIIRVEFCVCGEYIRQLAGDSIPVTVQRHNAGHRHHTWRIQSSSGPTVAPDAVDVSNVPAVRPAGGRR